MGVFSARGLCSPRHAALPTRGNAAAGAPRGVGTVDALCEEACEGLARVEASPPREETPPGVPPLAPPPTEVVELPPLSTPGGASLGTGDGVIERKLGRTGPVGFPSAST